ncbi:hypothetical protein Goshw_018503 [Gossypium schwendimanii]|uniref:RNase H type-1 domain-containing protein n=1 Tax=Gossypium schwendimanii TaxID=34291 RepID=A0A7J9N0W3_GOSSC|nr:hypothetical protein [Gossypium schwendimanii]
MRNKPLLLVTPVERNWTKATYVTVKINFDVSMSTKKIGYGLIARDSDGFVLRGGEEASWTRTCMLTGQNLTLLRKVLNLLEPLTSLKSCLKLIASVWLVELIKEDKTSPCWATTPTKFASNWRILVRPK